MSPKDKSIEPVSSVQSYGLFTMYSRILSGLVSLRTQARGLEELGYLGFNLLQRGVPAVEVVHSDVHQWHTEFPAFLSHQAHAGRSVLMAYMSRPDHTVYLVIGDYPFNIRDEALRRTARLSYHRGIHQGSFCQAEEYRIFVFSVDQRVRAMAYHVHDDGCSPFLLHPAEQLLNVQRRQVEP